MARYVNEFQTQRSDEQINAIVADFLNKEGFQPFNYNGEPGIYKKGVGALTAPQFIKFTTAGGKVHIEAFIKFAWLPGVYSGEMSTSGFFGAVPKKILKGSVTKLEQLLTQ